MMATAWEMICDPAPFRLEEAVRVPGRALIGIINLYRLTATGYRYAVRTEGGQIVHDIGPEEIERSGAKPARRP